MKRYRLSLVSGAIHLCSGCSVTLKLYPVKGPLAQQRQIPVLETQVNNMQSSSGVLSSQLSNLRRTRDLLLPRLLSGNTTCRSTPS